LLKIKISLIFESLARFTCIKSPVALGARRPHRRAAAAVEHPELDPGAVGDALITVSIAPHPVFERDGANLRLDLPVTLYEAVLGGKVTVPTIHGKVALTVPPGSNTGAVLRLKGKGIADSGGTGDQLVTLKVVLPENDAEFVRLVEKWGPRAGYDPRAKAGIS